MKAGFGLVALMVTIAILAYVWSMYTSEVSNVSQPAVRQAEQVAGFDEGGGKRAKDTIKTEPVMANGKLRGLLVTDLDAGGAMERYYGLKRDDQILAVGPIDFRGESDAGLAEAMLAESRQRDAEITVKRDDAVYLVKNVDKKPVWTLKSGSLPTAQPDATTSQPPATPQPNTAQPNETPARDTTKALDRQLQQIPGIPR
jgi:hypothetical protein